MFSPINIHPTTLGRRHFSKPPSPVSGDGHPQTIGQRDGVTMGIPTRPSNIPVLFSLACRPADARQTNHYRPSGRRSEPNVWWMPCASIATAASA